jgi:AmmeMemoRadiSam system protein B
MEFKLDIRPSPIAGKWYPGDPQRLADSIDNYLQEARLPEIEGEVVAVMAPHAGHTYSGPVAGFAFATLRNSTPDLVAVVSPMHYPYPQPLLTTGHSAYSTPLGSIPVSREAVEALDEELQKELGFGLTQVWRDPEHSLEIELPFLQRVLPNPFQLLPVMVREQDEHVARSLGTALAKVLQKHRAILVASTDLSHFYTHSTANELDAEVLRQVANFDPVGVLEVEQQGTGFACGKGALAAVLWAAKDLGADHVQVLQHATSGDVTGDFSQVVGYGAAVITRRHLHG